MVYSLARYRHLNPKAPFRLGGVFVRSGERIFLKDAHQMTEISGPAEGLRDGDWVEFEIEESGPPLKASSSNVVRRSESQRELRPKPHARGFSDFVYRVREHLREAGLSEIYTPSLVVCPGLEPSLEPFRVGGLYLPTSPEIHLKKAMAEGFTDIFEIRSCFRSKENSPHHAAEFLMLEWYRGFADLDVIIGDLETLLQDVGAPEAQVTSFRRLFREVLEFDLTPASTREELLQLCQRNGVDFAPGDTFSDLFHRLMIQFIEPALARRSEPTIVRDFPPSEAALARLTGDGWADRCELYWRGFEIANAFNEVTDPEEQRRRWAREIAERERLGTSKVPADESLIEALRKGLPPSGGIALGLERLYMALNEVLDIRELRLWESGLQP